MFVEKGWKMSWDQEILCYTMPKFFGLKMMVKSGLEKIILKFLHAQGLFRPPDLLYKSEGLGLKIQIQ